MKSIFVTALALAATAVVAEEANTEAVEKARTDRPDSSAARASERIRAAATTPHGPVPLTEDTNQRP